MLELRSADVSPFPPSRLEMTRTSTEGSQYRSPGECTGEGRHDVSKRARATGEGMQK